MYPGSVLSNQSGIEYPRSLTIILKSLGYLYPTWACYLLALITLCNLSLIVLANASTQTPMLLWAFALKWPERGDLFRLVTTTTLPGVLEK